MSAHAAPIHPDAFLYGYTAEFTDPADLMRAANRAREAGYTKLDCYTPFPIHGLDEAIGFNDISMKWTILFGGIAGFAIGLWLQWWTSALAYDHNVGGRPKFSWPSFFPVAYECTILFASLAAVVGMLAFNGLPRPNHPLFNARNFDRASQDRFFLCIESGDPKFDKADTKQFMDGLGALEVAEVQADEVTW